MLNKERFMEIPPQGLGASSVLRGWQTDTNAQGQVTDIYVPLDQVKGYIIIQKQAQANESP
jgi:hypothetical protein